MKRFFLSFVLILMATQVHTQIENDRLDSLMVSIYTGYQPGAAIAVVKEGDIVFKGAYGIADLNSKLPVSSSTNFNICSLTKQFTAYCILKLAVEKKLRLEDKIARYFPDFNPNIAGMITIRHLLTHSSGVIDHYDYADTASISKFCFRDRDVLNAIKPIDSVYFPPGSEYRYSNTAFCLLSLIIEQVSGDPFPEYIRKNIFMPLSMDKSYIINPEFTIPERAFGYRFENGSFTISDSAETPFFSTMGDGGMYASVDDYLKWILANLDGKHLNPGIIKDAYNPQFVIEKTKGLYYGYGWFTAGSGEGKIVYHTGSNGGFRTIIFMMPLRKYAVVIFSNRSGVDLEDLVRKINTIYQVDDTAYVKLDSIIS